MTTTVTGSPRFAAQEILSESDERDLDRIVTSVAANKAKWANTPCKERIALLNSLLEAIQDAANTWVETSCHAKGHAANTPPEGEEWLVGPCILARNLRLLRNSIAQIEKTGKPKLPVSPYKRSDGQVVAKTFPTSIFDKLLFKDFEAEVWMDPSIDLDELTSTMAVSYGDSADKAAAREEATCLVLCAGNVSSIGPMDALYKLFVENQVVVFKTNPVNEYLADPFEAAFAPLIRAGFMAIVKGGATTGKYLCEHELVDEIHITGSDKTHDAIVFGTGDEGEERKRNRTPVCNKRVTSELGNVSPVIVVPGRWSKSEITFQAENVASMLAMNAGFNCNSIRVLVTQAEWPQREEFLTALARAFDRIPARRAYYPGAADRLASFVANRESVTQSRSAPASASESQSLPWTIIRNVDAADVEDICFTTEAFCSLMAETNIQADSTTAYLNKAVEFVNQHVWGTLNAGIIVSPKTLKQKGIAESVDRAIADLEYGTIAVNHWPGLNFGLCSTTWGAFPGHPSHDIQSGSGVVHNTYMFDRPQKTVLRGPFKAFPKPVWFATHRNTHKIGKALFKFECAPSWLRLPSVLIHAIG